MTFELQRDSRISIYKLGGLTKAKLENPINITLDAIPDDTFSRVKEIIDLLQNQKTTFQNSEWDKYNEYHIKLGEMDTEDRRLTPIFSGKYYKGTPVIVVELDRLLKAHVESESLELKL